MRSGTRIASRFLIDTRVGAGGMGTVYRARDEQTGTAVAIKVVREPSERFDREADLLARLSHPGIVRHIAHGRTEAGEQFLVMDWLDGEDLQRRLGRERLSAAETLELGRVLGGALAEVHARGIVHRDVKPSNIWLVDGRADRPVLLDFGVARPLESWRLTATGAAVGTPQYMAPEQIQTPSDVDARADVYALGAVMFECIAGRPPFVGESAVALFAKVLLEDAPALLDVQPDTPPPLAGVVRRALSKRRDDRPADARALASELDRISLGDATLAAIDVERPIPASIGAEERRLVCVVIAGSGATDVTVTPEQLSDELARAHTVASTHGAQLLPVAGGYVATSYSTGIATDHARRAARYALQLATELPASPIALTMGWGTVGPIPVGDAIDRAAALLEAGRAPGSGVRIDDVAAGLLDVGSELARDDASHILLGERRPGERPRTLLGRPTSCVGRDRDLRTLEDLFAEACEDQVARAALVTAPAGGGKSRIRHELLARLARSDTPPTIAIAHAEMLRAGSPLDLLARCVRALAEVDDSASAAAVQDQLRAHVRTRIPDAAPEIVEFLCEIVGAPVPAGTSAAIDAARADARTRGEQMQRAWLTLLAAHCKANPCALVLEDLHWGDALTVRFIDAALRELAHAPLFVLALARTEVHDRFPGLWRDRTLQEIRLGALPPRACARLVREVLPDLDDAAVDRIVQHSEGNAFFLEEMIRASASGGSDTAPTSVVAMVQARLDELDTTTRRVVRAASVFGEACRPAGLAAVLGVGTDAIEPALGRLVATEVMSRRSDTGLVDYAFRHALVREAAYAALTDDDRRVAHGLAARWLESMNERDALLLASHYEAAGERADAARCWADAAHQAFEKNDFDAAIARGQHALELEPSDPIRRRALTAMGRSAAALGKLIDAQRDLDAALALATEAAERIELLRDVFRVGVFRQDIETVERAGNEALAIATQLGRPDLVAEATVALACADHGNARCDQAVERYLSACRADQHYTFVHGLAGIILYHTAHFDEALYLNEKALGPAIEVRDWQAVANQYANMALAYAGKGEYAAADECFVKSREISERVGMLTYLARTISLSSGWQQGVFDYDGATRAAEEARYVGRDIEFSTPRVSALMDLATVAVRRGNPGDAEGMLDSIAKVIESGIGFHGWLWRLRNRVLRAEIAAAREDWQLAIELASDGAERCDQYRRVKYAVNARTVHARALAAIGRAEDAMPILARARADAERCGDPAWQLSVQLAALACGDRDALVRATRLAADIERALPATRAAIFRAATELSILG